MKTSIFAEETLLAMMTRLFHSHIFVFASLLLLVACAGKEVEVSSIALSQPSAEMEIGETLSLKANVSPSNASYDGVSWTSTKPRVASVSESGLVSALSEGNTTITAMAGGKTASCSITVVMGYVEVSSITLNKSTIFLYEGDTETLTPTISPENATNKTISWSSSNKDVATVKDGTITAIKKGEATITAKAGGKTAACTITVQTKKVSVTGVSLDNTSLSITEGDTKALKATVTPSNATDKSLSWSSNKTSVATVSSSGTVTAIAPGSATITVKTNDGGKTATCSIIVTKFTPTMSVPQAVDLGLSVKWASFNLGASEPEGNGDFFAWGETEPYYKPGYARSKNPVWKAGKEAGYEWTSYKWCKGTGNTLTKYCDNIGFGYNFHTDYYTTLTRQDDAAHVNIGGKWRIPKKEEMEELLNDCSWVWTTVNGVNGFRVTGPNGNSIFLPTVGCRFETSLLDNSSVTAGLYTYYHLYYWTSSLLTKSAPMHAWYLQATFESTAVKKPSLSQYIRCFGCAIRPVSD